METLKFISPENLYLLLPAGLLVTAGLIIHFILRKRFELFLRRSRAELFSRLRGNAASAVKLFFLGLTLIFLVLALGRPAVTRPDFHQNFLVLLDLSRSMSVEDCRLDGKPCSRLKMARTALKNLLDELPPEARLGLVTFAGYFYKADDINLARTFPQMVGASREELKQLIDWISWSQAWQSGSAVQMSIVNLIGYIKDHQEFLGDNLTIILITDGEENKSPAVYPVPIHSPYRKNDEKRILTASWNTPRENETKIFISEEFFKGLNLKFVVVGIGTPSGGPIPKFDNNWNFIGHEEDYNGVIQISRRDDVFLSELSQKLGAEYLQIEGPDDLKILASDPKYKTAVSEIQKDLSIYAILAALIFFLAALVL